MVDDSDSSDEEEELNQEFWFRNPRRQGGDQEVQEQLGYKIKMALPVFNDRTDIERFLDWVKNVENFLAYTNTAERKKERKPSTSQDRTSSNKNDDHISKGASTSKVNEGTTFQKNSNPYHRPTLGKCFRCGQQGHLSNECPQRTLAILEEEANSDQEVEVQKKMPTSC